MKSTHIAHKETKGTTSASLIKTRVDHRLDQFFDEQIAKSQSQSKEYERLWETIKAVAMSGGKRLRPYLLISSHAAFGGSDDLLEIAAAHELLHISMLMHDDIIDRDSTRHGEPNVMGKYQVIYGPQVASDDVDHYANSAALLAGDLLISSAYHLINGSQLTEVQRAQAMRILHDSIFTVVGGELSDVESSFMLPEMVDPLHVAHYKTAIYSCVNPLLTGAVLAGASGEDQDLLREFGVNLGIAFQLTDDLLGVFGSSVKTGKSTVSDLAEGKITYLITQALDNLSADEKKTFYLYFAKHDLTESEAETLRNIIMQSGAYTKTQSCIEQHIHKAEQALQHLSDRVGNMAELQSLLHKISGRES